MGVVGQNCEIFDFSCSLKNNLNRHIMSLHDGQKPFKCNICDYSCSQKKHLRVHIASVHDGKKHLKCEFCDFKSSYFCSQRNLFSVIFVTSIYLERITSNNFNITFVKETFREGKKRHITLHNWYSIKIIHLSKAKMLSFVEKYDFF